jgi:hypothetical protein
MPGGEAFEPINPTTGSPFGHPDWPLQFVMRADGTVTFAEVAQDTDDERKASAAVIASTPRGSHLGDAAFGVTSPLFEHAPLDADRLAAEIAQSDPRLDVTAKETADMANAARRILTVAVGRADTPAEA